MDWRINQQADHVVIYGPSQLEILLHDFDPAKAERGEVPPPRRASSLVERHWRYPLEPGIWLEGLSLRDPADFLDRPPVHVLHIGHSVSWHLPAEVAASLHGLMGNVGDNSV
jgi:hypothetical protein